MGIALKVQQNYHMTQQYQKEWSLGCGRLLYTYSLSDVIHNG